METWIFVLVAMGMLSSANSFTPIDEPMEALGNDTCYLPLKTFDMSEHCKKTETVASALQVSISSHRYKVLTPCLNCPLTLTTGPGNQLVATLVGIGTETSGSCEHNRLDVYDGPKADKSKLLSDKAGICGCKFPTKSEYRSSANTMTLRLHTACNMTQHGEIILVVSSVKNDLYNRTECYGQFHCRTGDQCVNKNDVCDGSANCRDKSDEVNCTSYHGKCAGKFECADGNCIDKNEVCDGSANCPDHSDERNCTHHAGKCLGKFECKNGRKCIDKSEICNGKDNCGDNSDEKDCHRRHLLLYILIGVAGLVLFVLLIILIVVCCKYCCVTMSSGYRAIN